MAFWSPSSLQDINEGSTANDGTGDSLRDAFNKVDSNFIAVSNQLGSVNQDFLNANVTNTLRVGTTVTANLAVGNVTTASTFYGNINVAGNIIPTQYGIFNLGSAERPFGNLYVQATISSTQIAASSDAGLLLVHANTSAGDVKDVGIIGNVSNHFSQNSYAFFGYQSSSSNFVYKITPNNAATIGNSVVYDGVYGNVNFGSLFLSNATEATSNISGVLIARGGISTSANIHAAGNIFTRGYRVLNTADVSTLGYPTYNGSGSLFVGNTVFSATTPSTTTTTGAVVLLGGMGVVGNVVAGGYLGDYFGNIRKADQPYITSLGTLTGLTVVGTIGTTSLQATSIGTIDLLSTGTITSAGINVGGTVSATAISAGSVISPTIGNTGATLTGTLSTANQPNITTLNTVAVTNLTSAMTGGSINNTVIGNTTPSTGRFTSVIATTVTAGTIGNVGAAVIGTSVVSTTGRFDTSVTTSTLTAATIGNVGATVIGATGRFDTSVTTGTLNAGTIGNTGATLTGTLSTAAQPNVTSLGTVTGLTVAGAILPSANLTYNLGSTSAWWNTLYGVSTQAKYADLAENYQADSTYDVGTVLIFGGTDEVTTTTEFADARVAGAISTNPAHLMNGGLIGNNVVALALRGRVPCNVTGPVQKGDLLVTSTTPGFAQSVGTDRLYSLSVFAKALETNLNSGEKVIEVVIL